MTMKIYTRKGDDGKTALLGGDRVSKHHQRVEAYGTIDELNSHIGLLRAQANDNGITSVLSQVQDRLFTLGSYLASSPGSRMVLPGLDDTDIGLLETEIDRLTSALPELKNFILPGASVAGSQAHVARCVCRRAERLVVMLRDNEEVEEHIIPYLNRLSDYLFTLARHLDHANGGSEIVWSPRTK